MPQRSTSQCARAGIQARQPLVSIVISDYNDIDNLRACLLSLRRLAYPNYEVTVVDCGSEDGSAEMVSREFPEFKLLRKGIIGVGEAINSGISNSEGQLLLLDLNSDDVVHPDFLQELVKSLSSQEKMGLACGKRYVHGTRVIDSAGARMLMWTATGPKLRARELDSDKFNTVSEVDYAGVYLVKREVIDVVGPHDEAYYVFFEDTDFCFRARYHGYKILYVPTAIHWHKGSSSVGKNQVKKHYFMRRNSFRFLIKHFSFPYLFTALAAQFIFSFFFVLSNSIRKKFDFVVAEIDAILWNMRNMKSTFISRARMYANTHTRILKA